MRRNRGLIIDLSPCKESSGSEYLLDSVKASEAPSTRWSGRRGRRLLRGGGVGIHDNNKIDLGHFEEPLRRLSFTDKELLEVIDAPEDFRKLQDELRKKGAITNSMVKEGIHFYVQNCLERKQSDSPKTMITPTASSVKVHRSRPFHTPPRS